MMDLFATVPYYTAYLSKALLSLGENVTVGSITYYLDRRCFTRYKIPLQPGISNIVGRFDMPRLPRRVLKLLEGMVNLAALSVRFLFSPPEVIHVQYLPLLTSRVPLDCFFLHLCRLRGSKIMLTVHDLLPHDTGDLYRSQFAELYAFVDGIICHSEHVRARLQDEFSVPRSKVSVIPHGPFFYDRAVDKAEAATVKELVPEENALLVLWQGIIFPYKGVDLLLEAWREVETKVPGAWLLIAGTGSPVILKEVRDQVQRLQLRRVKLELTFISTDRLVAIYRAADLVVYPYRNITTSGALATGLAFNKVIVASDLPVFRELLTAGQNSVLVPSGDSAALSQAIADLLQDTDRRSQIACSVREMDFGDETWLNIASQTRQSYLSLTS